MNPRQQELLVRERRAVAGHRCPKCKSQAHFRCKGGAVRGSGMKFRYLSRPHAERVALVSDQEVEKS